MKKKVVKNFENEFGVKVELYDERLYEVYDGTYPNLGVVFFTEDGKEFRGVYEIDIALAIYRKVEYDLENGMLGYGYYTNYRRMIEFTEYYRLYRKEDVTESLDSLEIDDVEKDTNNIYTDFEYMTDEEIIDILQTEVSNNRFNYYKFAESIDRKDYYRILGNNTSWIFDPERKAHMYVFEV